jgi:hypothetical protein
MRIGFLT